MSSSLATETAHPLSEVCSLAMVSFAIDLYLITVCSHEPTSVCLLGICTHSKHCNPQLHSPALWSIHSSQPRKAAEQDVNPSQGFALQPLQIKQGLFVCYIACSAATRILDANQCSVFGADPDAAGEYFDYSIDELGLQDIKAADVLIDRIVSKELATK